MIWETWAIKADICGWRCLSTVEAVCVVPVEGGQLPMLTVSPAWRDVWGALEWVVCPFPAAFPPSFGTEGEDNVRRMRGNAMGYSALKCLEIWQSICPVNTSLQLYRNSSQLLRDWIHIEFSEYLCNLPCSGMTGTLSWGKIILSGVWRKRSRHFRLC